METQLCSTLPPRGWLCFLSCVQGIIYANGKLDAAATSRTFLATPNGKLMFSFFPNLELFLVPNDGFGATRVHLPLHITEHTRNNRTIKHIAMQGGGFPDAQPHAAALRAGRVGVPGPTLTFLGTPRALHGVRRSGRKQPTCGGCIFSTLHVSPNEPAINSAVI